jgi:tetratricopeptide (TPR) repeat protein
VREPEPLGARIVKWSVRLFAGGLGLWMLLFVGHCIVISDPPEAFAPEPPRPAYEVHFQEGKNLIREGKWAEAKSRLLQAQELAPDMAMLADYLAAVEREIPNQERLKTAQASLSEGNLSQAKAQLDAVSPDTQQFEQLAKLKRELGDTVDSRLREAQALLNGQQREQALFIAEGLLAVFPEHPEALRIREQARPAQPAPPPPPEWSPAIARFMAGDLDGAVTLALVCMPRKTTCKAELKALTLFSSLHKKGKNMSTPELIRLFALDKQLAGIRTPSPRAEEFRGEARMRAKDLYLLGYVLKDSNPEEALQKLRTVLALTFPDDELHLKARTWLEKLER